MSNHKDRPWTPLEVRAAISRTGRRWRAETIEALELCLIPCSCCGEALSAREAAYRCDVSPSLVSRARNVVVQQLAKDLGER